MSSSPTRLGLRLTTVSAVIIAPFALVATAAPAAAAPAVSTTQTVSYACQGFPQYFDVPPGVTTLTVATAGAAGASNNQGGNPGSGATLDATLTVTPYHLLTIDVGCRSGYGYAHGGAGGGNSGTSGGGATGGGATGVEDTTADALMLVAAGGGGGGGNGGVVPGATPGGNGGNGASSGGTGGTGAGSGGGGGLGTASGPDGQAGGYGTVDGGGAGGGGGGYPTGGGGGAGGGLGSGGGGGGGGGLNYWNPTYTATVSGAVAGSAADGSVTISYAGSASVQSFVCTGTSASYTVPDGAYGLLVNAVGAAGGSNSSGGNGGDGSAFSARVAVSPGDVLALAVGCQGQAGSQGGFTTTWSPGGAGGYGFTAGGAGGNSNQPLLLPADYGGCGGGGSTGFLDPVAHVTLVSAGGGGCGGSGQYGGGGNGGYANTNANASAGSGVGSGGAGTLGGSSTGVGAGGGTPAQGTVAGGGGGGGGGYSGGGGGNNGGVGGGGGGGGGGGQSYTTDTGVSNVSTVSLSSYGGSDGLLEITPLFSQPKDLTVSTTASTSLVRTYGWGITKGVDPAKQTIAPAASATFDYTVTVTHDTGTDSAWTVSGSASVRNPNAFTVNGVTLTETTNNGGQCTVGSGTDLSVAAGASVVRSYTCTYQASPSPAAGHATVTATWPAYGSPDTSASSSTDADFSHSTPTVKDGSATVTDSQAGTLGTVTSTDASPHAFSYTRTYAGTSGACTAYPNTATFRTDTSHTTGSAGRTATVCKAARITAFSTPVSGTEGAAVSHATTAVFTTDASQSVVMSTFHATIDWGDGTTSAGTITALSAGYAVAGSHTYKEEGSYAYTVTITGDAGSTSSTGSTALIADAPITAEGGLTFHGTEGLSAAGQTVATFTDANPYGTAKDFTATIDWGDHTTSAGTVAAENGGFAVIGSHTYKEEGSYSIKVSIKDDGGSTTGAASTATVVDAPLSATGRTILSSSATFSGTVATFTDANPYATISDFTATIEWGDGAGSAGTIEASGEAFTVSGGHTYAALGPETVTVKIVDDGGSTATVTTSLLAYAYPASGIFTLGDQTVAHAAPDATLTWWGAQWTKDNSLAGGAAPDAFKGYADTTGTPPLACGGTWTTRPGTSPAPPAKVPTYLAVIVTSKVTQSGSTLSGTITHIVVVKTDPGYAPDAGDASTGTIVAKLC